MRKGHEDDRENFKGTFHSATDHYFPGFLGTKLLKDVNGSKSHLLVSGKTCAQIANDLKNQQQANKSNEEESKTPKNEKETYSTQILTPGGEVTLEGMQ